MRLQGERETYECVVHVPDPPPLAVLRQDLQRSDGLAPENSDGPEVCRWLKVSILVSMTVMQLTRVALEPDVLRVHLLFLRTRVAACHTHERHALGT